MKKYRNRHIIGVLVIVLVIFTLTQIFPRQFIMQYLDEDMNLVTEIFGTRKDFNEKAEELKADGVSYWLYHE